MAQLRSFGAGPHKQRKYEATRWPFQSSISELFLALLE